MSERTISGEATPAPRGRPKLDWLFEAGCTAVFLVLLGTAVQAVWLTLR